MRPMVMIGSEQTISGVPAVIYGSSSEEELFLPAAHMQPTASTFGGEP